MTHRAGSAAKANARRRFALSRGGGQSGAAALARIEGMMLDGFYYRPDTPTKKGEGAELPPPAIGRPKVTVSCNTHSKHWGKFLYGKPAKGGSK